MENYIKIDGVQIELTKEQVEQIKSLGISSNKKPRWEDFGEVEGWYISAFCSIGHPNKLKANEENKNLFPTKEEAEACLALSQLCQWRDKYNEGWRPDWERTSDKYCILFNENRLSKCAFSFSSQVLSFKTEKIRDKFLEDFKDLIEIAKPLL